jgi:hypothetical protein
LLEHLEDRTLLSTVTWVGPATGGDWDTAANWSTNALPGSGDDVVIPANISITHTANNPDIVNSLSTNGGDAINVSGGSLAINATTNVTGNLTLSGSFQQLGAVNITSGTLDITAATIPNKS